MEKLWLPESSGILIPETELKRGLKVEKSLIDGLGLFADRDFQIGKIIWAEILRGPKIIGHPESDGPLRWANHSDNPNSLLILGQNSLVSLVAQKPIVKHQEITYSYGVFGHTGFHKTCKCGAPNCQGIFVLREEWGEKK